MIKKILSFIVLILIIFLYFINLPSIRTAAKLKLIAEIDEQQVTLFDKTYKINSIFYWNRLNKIAKISINLAINYIEQENSYFYSGKDFFLFKKNQNFYIINKKNEEKNFLLTGEIALTNKDSNLFAIVQKNGLQISFYQFVPLQNRAIELKREVFSSFYTSFEITRNSFYFSLMNGNCYIYNPFESISSENLVENSPFIYSISANSSSNDYVIISGYNPQQLIYLNKNGNILFKYIFENNYIYNYCHLLDNQLLLIKNLNDIKIIKLNIKKESEFVLLNELKIKGEVLDALEFFSYIVFIVSDSNHSYLIFYNIDTNQFFKRIWKEPIYQLDLIDTNGIFSVYNENRLWILSLKQELR